MVIEYTPARLTLHSRRNLLSSAAMAVISPDTLTAHPPLAWCVAASHRSVWLPDTVKWLKLIKKMHIKTNYVYFWVGESHQTIILYLCMK